MLRKGPVGALRVLSGLLAFKFCDLQAQHLFQLSEFRIVMPDQLDLFEVRKRLLHRSQKTLKKCALPHKYDSSTFGSGTSDASTFV